MTLDPVRERFAQEYHTHGNASEAYRAANPKAKKWKPETLHPKASKLLAEDKVRTRLAELQAASAKKHEITVERLTEMTLAAYTEAQRVNPTSGQMQTSSMIKAAEFLGKLHGLIVDKTQLSGDAENPLELIMKSLDGLTSGIPANH